MEIQKKQVLGKEKLYRLITLLLTCNFLLLFNHPTPGLHDQYQPNRNMLEMNDGIYLVVGSFTYFENAERFSDMLFVKGYPTKYGYYSKRGYYYVYIDVYSDINLALANYHKYRDSGQFPTAWLLTITGPDYTEFGKNKDNFTNSKINIDNQFNDNPQNNSKNHQSDADQKSINEIDTNKKAEKSIDMAKENLNEQEVAIAENSLQNTRPENESSEKSTDKSMFFNVYDVTNNNKLQAKILMIDHAKSSLMDELQSNQSVTVSVPNNEGQKAEFISNIFGYRKVQRGISFENQNFDDNPTTSIDGEDIVIDFGLTRLRKGDIVTMYNVFFFNNSAIMKNESKFEVDQLLKMLRENQNYEIMIHGHTNGKAHGTIIKMDKNDTNFFEFSSNNKETYGSAKQLSKERAKIIHRYLLHNGIDKKRIDFKGWGGKKMIYPPKGPLGKQNARVEIEVLED